MLIIVNKRIPDKALLNLYDFGNIIPFSTQGITYSSISCHPDIFIVQTTKGLVVSPNLTLEMKKSLADSKISFKEGNAEVGNQYPKTAIYNAVITDEYLIHNLKVSDSYLLSQNKNLEKIHVNQAYTRCNLLALKRNHFITSDKGIEKVLAKRNLAVLYINPEKIDLPGMKHGFFGGCCGVVGNSIFVIGNLDFLEKGKVTRKFIDDLGYNLVELYDGPLFDGGSLIFIDK